MDKIIFASNRIGKIHMTFVGNNEFDQDDENTRNRSSYSSRNTSHDRFSVCCE